MGRTRLKNYEKKECLNSSKEKCLLSGVNSQESYAPDNMEKIRLKAYELYEKRGCQSGYEIGDWLEAEKMICSK